MLTILLAHCLSLLYSIESTSVFDLQNLLSLHYKTRVAERVQDYISLYGLGLTIQIYDSVFCSSGINEIGTHYMLINSQ
uniref:Uncharacterized protein n=1 Tax=Octopus bimaculoides TaxID=37653 RepID=A0A0L8GXR2_OCTBM